MAGYKRPQSYTFMREDEVPRNALGKILYRMLKTQLAVQTAASGSVGAAS